MSSRLNTIIFREQSVLTKEQVAALNRELERLVEQLMVSNDPIDRAALLDQMLSVLEKLDHLKNDYLPEGF